MTHRGGNLCSAGRVAMDAYAVELTRARKAQRLLGRGLRVQDRVRLRPRRKAAIRQELPVGEPFAIGRHTGPAGCSQQLSPRLPEKPDAVRLRNSRNGIRRRDVDLAAAIERAVWFDERNRHDRGQAGYLKSNQCFDLIGLDAGLDPAKVRAVVVPGVRANLNS